MDFLTALRKRPQFPYCTRIINYLILRRVKPPSVKVARYPHRIYVLSVFWINPRFMLQYQGRFSTSGWHKRSCDVEIDAEGKYVLWPRLQYSPVSKKFAFWTYTRFRDMNTLQVNVTVMFHLKETMPTFFRIILWPIREFFYHVKDDSHFWGAAVCNAKFHYHLCVL